MPLTPTLSRRKGEEPLAGHFRRKRQSGTNVFRLQLGIRLKKFRLGNSFGRVVDNQRDPDPRTPNTGPSETDVRVNRNPLEQLSTLGHGLSDQSKQA